MVAPEITTTVRMTIIVLNICRLIGVFLRVISIVELYYKIIH